MDYVICLCRSPDECACDWDIPKLGDYRYWPKYDAVVTVVDLILGAGVYDALVCMDNKHYVQTSIKELVPTAQANEVTKAARKKRLQPHYRAQAAWDQINGPTGTYTGRFSAAVPQTTNLPAQIDPVERDCSCDMLQLMRSGCACGGK